jgi:hypothetical protein
MKIMGSERRGSPRDAYEEIISKYGLKKELAERLITSSAQALRTGADSLPDIKIYSNIGLNLPYQKFDVEYFVKHVNDHEMEDCILLLDEAYLFMDSRSGQSKINKLGSYFVAQTRKRGVDMFVCVQHIDLVDKRLRRAVDERGTCRYHKESPCSQCGGSGRKNKKSGVSVGQKESVTKDLAGPIPDEEKCPRCLGYGETGWATTTFWNKKTCKKKRITIFGPAVWWLFDTKELIEMTGQQLAVKTEDL